MDVASRIGRLQAMLPELGCGGLVVTKLVNIRYLTGFTGSAGLVFVGADHALLVSDVRYRDQAVEQLKATGVSCEVEIGRPPAQIEAIDRASKGTVRIGLESEDLSWGAKRRFAEALTGTRKLVAVRHGVERLRAVKDAGELARMERAADIADVALAQVKPLLAERPTEVEFALELDFEMRRRGAEQAAFETIVASGPNGGLPHARPTDRRVESGEFVVVDFGAAVEGYRSDMTRTFVVGEPRTRELADLLDAVLAAQRIGVRTVRPGVSGGEVDAACRASLAAAGLAHAFAHGTGHGVGLEIHEHPAVSEGSTDILAEGNVVTVEPGAYLFPSGGVRIEDTLVITAGGARPLTKSTKDANL